MVHPATAPTDFVTIDHLDALKCMRMRADIHGYDRDVKLRFFLTDVLLPDSQGMQYLANRGYRKSVLSLMYVGAFRTT